LNNFIQILAYEMGVNVFMGLKSRSCWNYGSWPLQYASISVITDSKLPIH